MDRLFQTEVSFKNSYTTSPVCIPARSSMWTGRMPTETGMWFNSARSGNIEEGIPTVGQWLREKAGYDTVFAGKWDVPHCNTYDIPGFEVLASGCAHWGEISDDVVSQACSQYLLNRDNKNPFLMVCSLIQPHDICMWLSMNMDDCEELRYPEIAKELPPLPKNFEYDRAEPELHRETRKKQQPAEGKWDHEQWKYYLWAYYRHVEMVDAQVERVLTALEQSEYADNTLVILTSDHGEGLGEHQMVRKGYLYDSCCKVPLIFSFPGRNGRGYTLDNLVSGVDITPTICCDFARVGPPPDMAGVSLKPLLEGKTSGTNRPLGDFVVTEKGSLQRHVDQTGRIVRSPRYKYIKYFSNDTEQLFDMQNDRGETQNLANDPVYAQIAAQHRQMLRRWEGSLKIAPRVAKAGGNKWKEL